MTVPVAQAQKIKMTAPVKQPAKGGHLVMQFFYHLNMTKKVFQYQQAQW